MMKNIKIGRLFGIEVRLHGTFPLFVLLVGLYYGYEAFRIDGPAAGLIAAVQIMGVVSTLFAFVLLHELGHSLVALRFKIPVLSITLLPIGGLAATGAMPRRSGREILIAVAGPVVNLLLAVIIALLMFVFRIPFSIDGAGLDYFLSYLLAVNIVLALFNLVPAFPMDGGRVLRALLALGMPFQRATRRAVLVGKVFAALFFLIGMFKHEFIMLSFIGIFLFFSGRRELQSVEFEDFLRKSKAGEFVDSRPWFYGGRDTRFFEICTALSQNEDLAYTVLDLEGLRYGILTRRQLLSACLAMPPMLEVRRLVEDSSVALPAQTSLYQALPMLRQAPHGLLPVRSGPDIVGVLSLENLEPMIRNLGRGFGS